MDALHHRDGTPTFRRLLPAAVFAAAFALFWTFRANAWTGGDSEQWEREIGQGVWLRKRQMLSFAAMQAAYSVAHPLFGWTAHRAINFVSCFAGGVAAAGLWALFSGRRHRRWEFALAAAAGYSALFFGHIETYASPAAALIWHLVAADRVAHRRWPLWTVPATWALALAFHLSMLFLLPAVLLFTVREWRLRGGEPPALAAPAVPLAAAALFLAALRLEAFGGGEYIGYNFEVPPDRLLRGDVFGLLFSPNIPLKFQFAWWNAGAGALLAFWCAVRVLLRLRHRRASLHLCACFACFLAFTAIWHPDAKERDWDLFSFPWMVASVLVASHAMALPLRALWVGLALGSNVLLFASRPLVFSEFGSRGHGTIRVEFAGHDHPAFAIMDDREPIREEMRFIRAGVHRLTLYAPPERAYHLFINMRDGEVHRVRIGERIEYLGAD